MQGTFFRMIQPEYVQLGGLLTITLYYTYQEVTK